MFTLSPVAYISVDFKKMLIDLFYIKKEKTRVAPKHNNSLETFPYAIQKHLAMHQSDFTVQIPN